MTAAEERDQAETIATACRLLAYLGLVRETTGHVSARVDGEQMLIRCRGSQESGLVFTEAECVRKVPFVGAGMAKGESEYETPSELPIHGEMYILRPEVNAVVHAHPRASLVCTLAGLPLKPIFGSYDIHAMALADEGVPVFPRSVLIRERYLGQQLAAAMGTKHVCIMRGHGITTVGRSVQEATIRAIHLETLASVTLDVAKVGGKLESISDEDLEYFRRLRATQDKKHQAHGQDILTWTWRHYVKLLEAHEAGRG
jgi:3,4-dihydroxyphthalate decarboxylase